jgi:hypothetical protein
VIHVPVTQDDGLDRLHAHAEPFGVGRESVGEIPVSNSRVWVEAPRWTVTRAEDPCSATSSGNRRTRSS